MARERRARTVDAEEESPMEHTSSQPTSQRPPKALEHIVCGVDGGPRSVIAAEQACRLAGRGRVTFVAVAHSVGRGATAQASLGVPRAQHALQTAQRIAQDQGVTAETDLLHDADEADALMRRAEGADILAIGAPLHGRIGGLVEGATSARVAHRATVPVLIARDGHHGPFARSIVLATDGSAGSEHAAELTAAIASTLGSEVTMVHAGESADAERHRMAVQAQRIADATGTEPTWAVPTNRPVAAICNAAEWNEASLIVIGARGVSGVRALGSVSERVAHEAPCSVLIARG
jgi:nucleotide-binding universal stress UspA family protein